MQRHKMAKRRQELVIKSEFIMHNLEKIMAMSKKCRTKRARMSRENWIIH